jgi:tetratricopeptide (TPR) repeat protein
MVLRTVGALNAAKVPPRKIKQVLQQVLPRAADTRPIRARDGQRSWEPASGQYELELQVSATAADILTIGKGTAPEKALNAAQMHYVRGARLEADDASAARAAYESCLADDCTHLQARINLGRLLHLEGLLREAEQVYRATGERDATLSFNLAVLLEDLARDGDAIAAYREAIVHDPGMADSHYNLSLLLEKIGDTQGAFRHLLAYRRLLQARAP